MQVNVFTRSYPRSIFFEDLIDADGSPHFPVQFARAKISQSARVQVLFNYYPEELRISAKAIRRVEEATTKRFRSPRDCPDAHVVFHVCALQRNLAGASFCTTRRGSGQPADHLDCEVHRGQQRVFLLVARLSAPGHHGENPDELLVVEGGQLGGHFGVVLFNSSFRARARR